MVSYFNSNSKVQRNERQSTSEIFDQIRSEQADQRMRGAIIVENIRDEASRSEQTDPRRVIRLEQNAVKATGLKTRQIREERKHQREREELWQKRKDQCSEKIRAESEKISVEQSRASSVVQKNAERGEYRTGEGRQTTEAKYTERWKIMR